MALNRIKSCLLACGLLTLMVSDAAAQHYAGPGNPFSTGLRAEQLPDPGHHLLRDPLPIGDLQLFAPADISLYGGDAAPREGYFGSWEWLYWSISAPEKDVIGEPGLVRFVHDAGKIRPQGSSFDTGSLNTEFHSGQRVEFGYVDGHLGWWFSGFRIKGHEQEFGRGDTDVAFVDQYQTFVFLNNDPINGGFFVDTATVGLLQGFVDQTRVDSVDDNQDNDAVFGRMLDGNGDGIIDPTDIDDNITDPLFVDLDDLVDLPVTFSEMVIRNTTDLWGFELMPFRRLNPTHRGSVFELGGGVRFLQFDDRFNVDAKGGFLVDRGQDTGTSPGVGVFSPTPLIESFWYTRARNDIIGPQLAARWFKSYGRLTVAAEGRYTAGFNFQRLSQEGTLGSNPDGNAQTTIGPRTTTQNALYLFNPISFNNEEKEEEFSNLAELRVKADIQVTRSILFTVGYNGMYMDGIARSSNLVLYRLPTMGIDVNDNRQAVWMHGVNVGVVVNR